MRLRKILLIKHKTIKTQSHAGLLLTLFFRQLLYYPLISFTNGQLELIDIDAAFPYGSDAIDRYNVRFMYANEL